MPDLPLRPHLQTYQGGKLGIQIKTMEANALAQRIVGYVNKLIATDPDEVQQILFADVAQDLAVDVETVRAAIPEGGYHGITVRVSPEDREKLAHFR